MNPEIKGQWVAALRSGTYDQGQDYLHTRNDTYCCLGVLCDLAVKAGVIGPPEQTGDEGSWVYGPVNDAVFGSSSDTTLPVKVAEWAGTDRDVVLKSKTDDFTAIPEIGRTVVSVAELNDNGMSFDDLSNLIEKYL